MLQSMGLQRVGQDLATEQPQQYVCLSPFTVHLKFHNVVNRLYSNTKSNVKNEKNQIM